MYVRMHNRVGELYPRLATPALSGSTNLRAIPCDFVCIIFEGSSPCQ